MNCNPFTLGHRALIEYASARVRHLYVFAVEEDKSFFPFEDRLNLILAGTSDLPNVTVLPSGKFIISALTFDDYFGKESKQENQTIDSSTDVSIFASEIAPTLGISVRFAGEEPLDNVTRQYNASMSRILPRYGIDFEVIPRIEHNGEPISASRVRELLKSKNFNAIAKLVPQTTLDYLVSLE
jgi:[citrate (pro-3S)-lyase] ligase